MAHDVFISYSHKDKVIADAVCAHFEQNGLRCWYAPRDIEPGEDWANSIIKAIESCKVMVLIFTESSNLSVQVLREVSNACRAGAAVIPFRLTETEPVAGMMYYLSTVHWLDAMNDELSDAIRNLYELSKGIVDKQEGTDGYTPSAKLEEIYQVPKEAPKKKGKLIAIISAAVAVIVIGAVVGIIIAVNNPGASTGTNEVIKATSAAIEDEEPQVIDYTDLDAPTEVFNLGATTDGIGTDINETYANGNIQSNMQNRGYLATDGEWYYYRSNSDNKLCRMREDGSEVTLLTDSGVCAFCCYDGYIYYTTNDSSNKLCRMKPDGAEVEEGLFYDIWSEFVIVGDRVYSYSSIDGLESVNLNGEDERVENTLEDAYLWTVDGNYMYYVYYSDEGDPYLHRSKLDGSESETLLEKDISCLTRRGDKVYFSTVDNSGIYTCDSVTGEVKKLLGGWYTDMSVTDDGLVAYDFNEGGYVYYSFDDHTQTLFLDHLANEYQAAGNKFFYDVYGTGYCVINLDGTGKTVLN